MLPKIYGSIHVITCRKRKPNSEGILMALVWRPRQKRWEVRDRKKKLVCIAYADGPKDSPLEKIVFEWPRTKRSHSSAK